MVVQWKYNGDNIYIYIMDYNGIFMVYHGILMGLPSGKRTACEVDNHIQLIGPSAFRSYVLLQNSMHIYIYLYVHVCVYVDRDGRIHVYTYIRTYIHTCIHTSIHT